jgi:hypothetical protein
MANQIVVVNRANRERAERAFRLIEGWRRYIL